MNPNWQHSAVAVRRVHLFFSVLVLVTMVRQFFLGNFEGILMCLLTLGLFAVPTLIRRHTQIDLPILLEVLVLLFIFAAEILGEIHNFYGTFPYWDVMLHVINGFLAAAIGLSLVEILNQKDLFHSELSPLLLVLLAFTFSMTIGVLWEFFLNSPWTAGSTSICKKMWWCTPCGRCYSTPRALTVRSRCTILRG